MKKNWIISMIFSSVQNKSSSTFLSLGWVINMFLNFRSFQPHVLTKTVLRKKNNVRLKVSCFASNLQNWIYSSRLENISSGTRYIKEHIYLIG